MKRYKDKKSPNMNQYFLKRYDKMKREQKMKKRTKED